MRVRDLVALTKPRITLMVILTAAAGMWLAPSIAPGAALLALFALSLVVAAANALNCYLERDIDKLMVRTARRPLPAQRLDPKVALAFSMALAVISVPLLVFAVNPATGVLGALSLALYVGVYTPLKQKAPVALLVGAIPGAMPPLMGWTSATGTIDAPGLVLFGILFLWQLPHFIAISTFREKEYSNAGHKVLPAVRGRRMGYLHAVFWATLLVPVAVALEPLGVAPRSYTVIAAVSSVAFLVITVAELRPSRGDRGALRVFIASLLYLPVVFAALLLSTLF